MIRNLYENEAIRHNLKYILYVCIIGNSVINIVKWTKKVLDDDAEYGKSKLSRTA